MSLIDVHPIFWLIALVGLILFFKWFNRLPKAARSRLINRILPVIAVGLVLFFIVRGLHPLLAVVGALLPLLPRLIGALQAIISLRLLVGCIPGVGRGKTSDGNRRQTHHEDTHAGQRPPPTGKMTIAEAYNVLGLAPGSNRQDIIATHRKLIQKLHPDRGGSTFLATQINQAKDLLLAHVEK